MFIATVNPKIFSPGTQHFCPRGISIFSKTKFAQPDEDNIYNIYELIKYIYTVDIYLI